MTKLANNSLVRRLTGTGEGPIAVYEFCGIPALRFAQNHLKLASGLPVNDLPVNRIFFGYWAHSTGSGRTAEDVVACRTSDTTLEVHTHGSQAVFLSIRNQCRQMGLPFQDQIPIAETLADLSRPIPLPPRLERFLANFATGFASPEALVDWLEQQVQTTLLQITAPTAGEAMLMQGTSQWVNELAGIGELADTAGQQAKETLRFLGQTWRFGKHLIEPIVVLLTGAPNVGKSSLINSLLGYQRAIVSPVAGTTRDLVSQETVIQGLPYRLIDSAGIRDSADDLEQIGVQRAKEVRALANVVVRVEAIDELTSRAPSVVSQPQKTPASPIVTVRNKCDLVVDTPPDSAAILTSTITGQGIPQLLSAIAAAGQSSIGLPIDWQSRPFVFSREMALGCPQ